MKEPRGRIALFFQNRMKVSKNIRSFAVADRFAHHASRVVFAEPIPGLGLSGAGCSENT